LDSLFRENKLIVSEARYTNLNKKFCGNGRTTDKSNRTKENKDEWALYLINKIISHDLIQYGKEFINIITIPLIEERERVCNSSE